MNNDNQANVGVQPQIHVTQQVYYQHSGFGTRLLALIVDGIIILITTFFLNLIIQLATGQSPDYGEGSIFQLLAALVALVYSIALLTLYGATLGKMLLHIRVVNNNFQKASFFQVLKRETIGKILSGIAYNLGYLWVAFDDKKQAWHDKIAKTYVIHTQPITYEEYAKQHEKGKVGSLPYVLIFAGSAEGTFISIFAFSVVSKLTSLYENFEAGGYNPTLTYLVLGLIGLSCVAKIALGSILWSKRNTPEAIKKGLLTTSKVLLIMGVISFVLLIPFLVLSVIIPIYNLTSSF